MDGNMAEPPKPRRRWRKWLLITFSILGLIAYGLAQLAYTFDKGATHAVQYATDIAVGLNLPEDGYATDFYRDPAFQEPTCTTSRGDNRPYWACITLGRRAGDYAGCAWWRFEDCLVLRAQSHLLTRPRELGLTLDAVRRPCRYLPTPAEIEADARMSDSAKYHYNRYFKKALCFGHPDEFPRKVVVNFRTPDGDIAARFVKQKSD